MGWKGVFWDLVQPCGAPVGVGIPGEVWVWGGGGLSVSIPAQGPCRNFLLPYQGVPQPGFEFRGVSGK